MKYYSDPNGKLFGYESDGSQDHLIPEDQTLLSMEAVTAALAPTPAEMIAAAHARINAAYSAAVDALTAGYPKAEIDSWAKQEAEARAFLADETAETPWLKGAAAARRINIPNFAALVIRQADALAPLHGALTGKRQTLRDAIDALGANPTQSQLDAIVR